MDRASVWMHGVEEVFTKDDFEVQVNAEEFSLKNRKKDILEELQELTQ